MELVLTLEKDLFTWSVNLVCSGDNMTWTLTYNMWPFELTDFIINDAKKICRGLLEAVRR